MHLLAVIATSTRDASVMALATVRMSGSSSNRSLIHGFLVFSTSWSRINSTVRSPKLSLPVHACRCVHLHVFPRRCARLRNTYRSTITLIFVLKCFCKAVTELFVNNANTRCHSIPRQWISTMLSSGYVRAVKAAGHEICLQIHVQSSQSMVRTLAWWS